jgi:hypothetical protein
MGWVDSCQEGSVTRLLCNKRHAMLRTRQSRLLIKLCSNVRCAAAGIIRAFLLLAQMLKQPLLGW